MGRRRYGTGSLHQRGDTGRWVGRLPDGRGGYRYFTGTDREEVRRRLDEARRERDRRTSSTPRGGLRVRDLMDRYAAQQEVTAMGARFNAEQAEKRARTTSLQGRYWTK